MIGKFDTLKQMADFYHIPYEALEKQNERMNGFLKNKQDPDLGCKFFPDSLPNDKGPFYAVRLWPRVHHTMGGLEINDKSSMSTVNLLQVFMPPVRLLAGSTVWSVSEQSRSQTA